MFFWKRNEFDRLLKKAQKQQARKILIPWNRGLGDIALGLYALIVRIRHFIPEAEITFLTRPDLEEGFHLLDNVSVFSVKSWKRGDSLDLDQALQECNLQRASFDLVLENPNPTKWLKWQLGTVTPKLKWENSWDALCERFELKEKYIAVHVQTETHYNYEKNWPKSSWEQLFKRLPRIVLFGLQPTPSFSFEGVVDLRGKTTLMEALSIIKNRCSCLIAPDSGILSLTYFIDSSFPLRVVSLWADADKGILKQNVISPNPQLLHVPLRGKNAEVGTITVDEVMHALCL